MQYLWLVFTLASVIAVSGYRIVNRAVMKRHSAYAYALLINVVGVFLTWPLVFYEFELPSSPWPWLLVLLSTALWCVIMVLANLSFRHLSVSRREPIFQTEVVWVLLFSVLFLRESLSWMKLLGIGFILAALLLLTVRSQKAFTGFRHKGVQLTLLVAFLGGLVVIVDKKAMEYFGTGIYTFLLYLLPALVLLFFLPARWRQTKHLVRHGWVFVLAAGLLSVVSYYTSLRAYDLAEASVVFPLLALSTLFIVAGGMLFFPEEREHAARKLLAGGLAFIGALLVAGYTLL